MKDVKLPFLKEIMDRLLSIEEMGYCVFVDYSGHVRTLEIRIYLKWSSSRPDKIISFGSYHNGSIKALDGLIEELKDRKSIENERYQKTVKDLYDSNIEIGVPKKRAIKNVAEEVGITQKKVSEILKAHIND